MPGSLYAGRPAAAAHRRLRGDASLNCKNPDRPAADPTTNGIQNVKSLILGLFIAALPLGAAAFAQTVGDPVAGKKVFGKCAACHSVGPDAKNKAGPVLNGMIGQKAGEVPDYSFSNAMKNSGIVWDEAALTEYLRSPRTVVPGTKMTFPGLKKDKDIANVIAYLKTFAIDGSPAQADAQPAAEAPPPAPAPAPAG